jgi:hypothetical protein
MAEYIQVPDRIDLQGRVDTATASLEVTEDVIRKPLYDIHIRVCSRHALL